MADETNEEAELLEDLEREVEVRPELRDQFGEILDEFTKRKWSELEVVEHAGYLLFPDRIARRSKSGKVEVEEVRVRILRPPEMRKARAEARKILKDDGLDAKEDRDLFDQLENVCILARAIRNTTEPYEPLEPDPQKLEKRYDTMSLNALWVRLDAWNKLLNPRPEAIGKAEFIALLSAIAEGRTIAPLAAIDGAAQASFMITTACLLHGFLVSRSSSRSSGISTQEPSASKSSSDVPA